MNEAINIDPDKIDFPNNRMTIYFSKTKNQRVVPIHLVIVGILKYLISIKGKSTKLFDCTYDHMSHIFHDVLCELGLRVKGFKYYSLRSTHVTTAKFNGVRDDAQHIGWGTLWAELAQSIITRKSVLQLQQR
jgi:integrase